MEGLFSLRAHFRAFGFVVLRAALDGVEVAALAAEADTVVRDATGTNYLVEPEAGGITGHYIPATGQRTPVSVSLLIRFAPVAEELAGVPLVPSVVQHILFFDCASWHTDTGHAVSSVKVVAYLEPLTADTGALRVLPGSHRLDERVLSPVMYGPAFRSEDSWRRAIGQVPCHVIETVPGDVIVFDEHLWHASIGGRHRLQWSAEFVLDPASPEEELAVGPTWPASSARTTPWITTRPTTRTTDQPSVPMGRRGGSRSWTGWAPWRRPTPSSVDRRRPSQRRVRIERRSGGLAARIRGAGTRIVHDDDGHRLDHVASEALRVRAVPGGPAAGLV
jgi:Phytanoyl-CoA dioxygenase (PhyH)